MVMAAWPNATGLASARVARKTGTAVLGSPGALPRRGYPGHTRSPTSRYGTPSRTDGVLRFKDPAGLEQEIWAPLTTY